MCVSSNLGEDYVEKEKMVKSTKKTDAEGQISGTIAKKIKKNPSKKVTSNCPILILCNS